MIMAAYVDNVSERAFVFKSVTVPGGAGTTDCKRDSAMIITVGREHKIVSPRSRLILVCAGSLLMFLSKANAQFTVKPMAISQTMAPGKTYKITLRLENQGQDYIQVRAQTVDLAKDKDGQWVLIEGDTQDVAHLVMVESCRHWFALDKSETDLIGIEPGDSATLGLEVQIPAVAKGPYQAAVKVTLVPTVEMGVRVRYAFVVPVMLEVRVCEQKVPAQAHGFSRDQISALDLIAKYQATQDKLTSFISQGTLTTKLITNDLESREEKRSTRRMVSELRTHGERLDYRTYRWRNLSVEEEAKLEDVHFGRRFWDGKRVYERKKGQFKSYLWDGKRHYEHRTGRTVSDDSAFVRDEGFGDDVQRMKSRRSSAADGTLQGYISGSDRIDRILSEASSLSVRDEPENVGGVDCYVIDAMTDYGQFSIWLDPQHGYHIARVENIKSPDSLVGNGSRKGGTGQAVFTTEIVRFEEFDGIWIPMEAKSKGSSHLADGTLLYSSTSHYRRTSMQLNPDHDAAGSFVPQIEEGSRVFLHGVRGIVYTWAGSKIVDSEGRVPNCDGELLK